MKNLTKIKFKENGEFNHFPGNTVVANLYTKQDLMEVVDIIGSIIFVVGKSPMDIMEPILL